MGQHVPKEPMTALMLSLILPGLGQVYSHKFKRGVLLLSGWLFFVCLIAAYVLIPGTSVNIYTYFLFAVPVLMLIYICSDAVRSVKEYNAAHFLRREESFIKSAVLSLIFVIFVFVLNPALWTGFLISKIAGRYISYNYSVTGYSMFPSLIAGDMLLVNKLLYKNTQPQRGDVVLIRNPKNKNKILAVRIAGLPDETIEINDGHILINGNRVLHPLSMSKLYYYNAGEFGKLKQKVNIPRELITLLQIIIVKVRIADYGVLLIRLI